MWNRNNTKRVNKDVKKTGLGLSDPKQWDVFSMLVGMVPYRELGTGRKCMVKGCHQPVYSKELGLCSFHRMEEAERVFEDSLRARQQQREAERTG